MQLEFYVSTQLAISISFLLQHTVCGFWVSKRRNMVLSSFWSHFFKERKTGCKRRSVFDFQSFFVVQWMRYIFVRSYSVPASRNCTYIRYVWLCQ